MTFIDLLPILFWIVIVPFLIVGVYYYLFLKSRKRTGSEQEESFAQDLIETPYDEPPLTEIHATVLRMQCEVHSYGTKMPHCHEEYFVTFLDESGKELTYEVDKDSYLALSEGQTGTIAIVNEKFYGFSAD